MRVPQPRHMNPIQTMRAGSPTQPSSPRVAGGTTGPQGTPGGVRRKPGAGGSVKLGPGYYLWALVAFEALAIYGFRRFFRRFHGG